ncbi:MAG: hypothetical protein ACIRZM_04140 [Ligilactobacillus ruminis]
MKYKIACRTYRDWNECPTLCESYLEIEARFFKIENGFVAAWFEGNESRIPDIYINANDVLTIEPIKGEEQ